VGAQGGRDEGDLCRVLQGFSKAKNAAQPPPWAVQRPMQGCRKSDLFSPQASWGDDCARRVLEHGKFLKIAPVRPRGLLP
jgi:hypothetical protein